MHSSVLSKIPIRLIRQLVDVHVDIAIRPYASTVGPDDSGIPHKPVCQAVFGVEVVDAIVLRHELVNEAVGVAFEAVGVAAALSVGGDIGMGLDFGKRVGVAGAQVARRDGVENALGEWRVIHRVPIGGELDSIEAL